jgi:DNA mismatch repair ATPase MutL
MVERLLAQYDSSSASSVLFKFNKALDLVYQEGSNMSDHLGKLNSIVNQIKSAGDITIENLHVVLMLRSIPETSNWKAVIENLKAQDEADLTKEKVARVLTERAAELATKQVNERTTELTLAVNSPSHTICYHCGKTGHIAWFCRSKGSRLWRSRQLGKSY